jgi:hypothetical protein
MKLGLDIPGEEDRDFMASRRNLRMGSRTARRVAPFTANAATVLCVTTFVTWRASISVNTGATSC